MYLYKTKIIEVNYKIYMLCLHISEKFTIQNTTRDTNDLNNSKVIISFAYVH